jgi:hypothetical protein
MVLGDRNDELFAKQRQVMEAWVAFFSGLTENRSFELTVAEIVVYLGRGRITNLEQNARVTGSDIAKQRDKICRRDRAHDPEFETCRFEFPEALSLARRGLRLIEDLVEVGLYDSA